MNCVSTARKTFRLLQELSDKARGVDFVSEGISRHDDHVRYAASTPIVYHVLNSYLNSQKIDRKDAIMDVGCGKGRMLAFFSRFPFGKVGGG